MVKTFTDRVGYYRNLINNELNVVANESQPASFYEPVKYLIEGGGKRIRPILVMLACKTVGGDIKNCLDAAIAIELIHNFTLVHDDIMDQDDLRRGRQTVHKKWDEATAILVGDGLVALAFQYLLKTDSKKIKEIGEIFTNGILELCEGQALDKEFESKFEIDLVQYISMIEKKTALLLMISLEIGAIIGNGSLSERKILRDFGKELGCAFQIQDDLLDIEATSGKTFGSDIQQRKKTFLFMHALNTANPSTKKQIIAIYKKSDIFTEEIFKIKSLFESTGTLKFARQEVEDRINKAQDLLIQLRSSESREDLTALLNWILKRKS